MSTYNSSLVCEEIEGSKETLIDLLPIRYRSIGNALADLQQANKVVKVSGSVIVSF